MARWLRKLTVFLAVSIFAAAGLSASDDPGLDAYKAGNLKQASRLWRQACDADDAASCFHLGVAFRDGEGVDANIDRALKLFEKACSLAHGSACFNLSVAASQRGDKAAEADYLERGCAADSLESCANLAAYLLESDTPQTDLVRGIMLLETACLSGEQRAGNACFKLSTVYDGHEDAVIADDPEAANRWLAIGCSYANLDSCTNLGFHYRTGYGTPQDLIKANALYALSCDDGDSLQCPMYSPREFFGGGSEYRGGNVKKRLLPVAGLYADACEAGLAQGCTSLAYAIMRSRSAQESEQQIRDLLARSLVLLPENWFAKWLSGEVEAGKLADWDRRNATKD